MLIYQPKQIRMKPKRKRKKRKKPSRSIFSHHTTKTSKNSPKNFLLLSAKVKASIYQEQE